MNKGFLIALAGFFCVITTQAQTVKTGVLVIGNGSNAIGAGVQSARSGANTTLLMTETQFEINPHDRNTFSPTEREFQKIIAGENVNNLARSWTDTVKRLTVIQSASWTKVKRSGGGWVMELDNGKTIKAEVLVDADRSGKLKSALEMNYSAPVWQKLDYSNTIYRNSVGGGYDLNGNNAGILPMHQLLVPKEDNLVITNPDQQSIVGGQAAGAIAAYASFFKKKTSEAPIKAIQGELVNFKLSLIPFADVSDLDSNWKAIQFVGLSGILKGDLDENALNFRPDRKVTTQEIKQPFKEHFYKAQIWFDDYTDVDITIAAALDLICYTGSKSIESTKADVIKNWNKEYGFNSKFELNRIINRREFAVLLYNYNNPFNVNSDINGRIAR